jgi:hypothetical protein
MQYVRPHLEYSVAAWSPWNEADKECLEKVQKRAVNMVSGFRARSYEERLLELGITTLEERREHLDMVQTYKILKGVDNVSREIWFDMASQGTRATRQSADPLNIRPQASRLEIRRNFFSQRVVEKWNKVPKDVKNAPSVQAFKQGHRAYLPG